eukprot:CAMPEP_0195030644 /NCGR_PEP_ID=MMETSP0326_2-20130528/59383_1 /TAXON_ID=2866 ORGANISM="Crypthecodinium cohnii, Strain Seligo" /NCGR_SAMPLE_ID=MMETSP0326_2 /ASSEMBLY_ACC=CAM_ASM_000348 /LENGTH=139 /DNA_ID=CAMNT_0040054009 /DNA_START=193 /DNA_END=610 /DNA_ORIENTATION=-
MAAAAASNAAVATATAAAMSSVLATPSLEGGHVGMVPALAEVVERELLPNMDGAFSGEMAPEVRGSSQTYGDRESGIACDRSISVLVDQCCAAIKDRSSTIKSNQRHFRSSLMAALSFGSCGCTCGGCGCGGNGGPPEA